MSTCPCCKQSEMELFHDAKNVPTNSCILLETSEEAIKYPRGDISLGFCSNCGFISNVAFNQKLTEYSGRYEETQGFSGTFNKFHKALAERLIEKYDLHRKDVLEIGCGKGEFITMLSELGNNRGVGFDPGYRKERNQSEAAKRVKFITDFYSEKYSDHKADFVCCKMTLEHIHRPSDFLGSIRRSIGDNLDTIIFFQVPNVTRILTDCSFEDIYYEHCSYFSPGSLSFLFRNEGFKVLNVESEYDDQYLTIEALPIADKDKGSVSNDIDLEQLREEVASFPKRCGEKLDMWKQRLNEYNDANKKVVLWGSGSKGVSFLTTLNVGDKVEYVVDINPYRQGCYMSGTGQEIVSPKFLKDYKPDVVIVMNAIYCDEIGRDLEEMGIKAEIVPV